MLTRFGIAVLALLVVSAPAQAQFVDIIEDFSSYTVGDNASLQAAWPATTNAGDPVADNGSKTIDENSAENIFGSFSGQAALFDGTAGVGGSQPGLPATGTVNFMEFDPVSPDASNNLVLRTVIGDPGTGDDNKKLTVGLRFTDEFGQENILELGFFNDLGASPSGFAYRAVIIGGPDPNWQPFNLPDNFNSLAEIGGPGFHELTAIITEAGITFTLDLFNDDLTNTTLGPVDANNNGVIDGPDVISVLANIGEPDALGFDAVQGRLGDLKPTELPGIDAINEEPDIFPTELGFNNIRFGIPSAFGSSAIPLIAIQEISLTLEPIILAGAVPEPASLALVLAAVCGLAGVRRRS